MIAGVDRPRRTLVIVGLAALLLVGAGAASRSSGRVVVDDLYDNGKIDRSWNCEGLLDGLTLLPEVSRSGYLSLRDELEQQVRAQCTEWPVPVNQSELVILTEFRPVDANAGDIYSIPWDIVIAGIVAGCLVILMGAAVLRQWRPRL